MLIHKTYEIDSCDDVELGIKRESKLEFKLSYDDEKTPEAFLFFIQGIGADSKDAYLNLIIPFCVQKLNVAFVVMDYHCIGNRPQTGSSFFLDDIDKLILKTSCEALDIKLPCDVDKIQTYEQMSEIFHFINQSIIQGKAQGKFQSDFFLNLHVSLQPTKNEYQNFGIMQAQDIANTVLYLKENAPFDMGEGIPIILIGGSHGGYLAHLVAKIAPWLIDGVIDNSGGAKFLLRMVGFGKEIDFMKYSEFATFDFFHHIKTHCSTKTFWTSNKASPRFFSPARVQIRNILEPEHLLSQAQCCKKTHYTSYHSLKDQYVSLYDKNALYKNFQELGFDAILHAITQESQIDGKFIKDLSHGMGIPMKLLIKKELPLMLERINAKPKQEVKNKTVNYLCENLLYQFSEKDNKISLTIKENN